QWLEVRFSTICNLRCVMCSPSLSTSLYKEFDDNFDKLSPRQKGSLNIAKKYFGSGHLKDSEFFMKEIKKIAQESRFFEFRGGEILQDTKMMEFIEELSFYDNAKNIYVDITTNGIGLNSKHIEILNRFYGGKLKMSIDAFGKENEYIRYPSKWNMTIKGMKAMKDLHDKWTPYIQATLSVFQAPTIVKLLDFLDEYERNENPNIRINITKVRGFDHLMLNLLPLSLRQKSSKEVSEFVEKSALCDPNHKYGNKNKESILGLSKALLEKESSKKENFKLLFEHVDSLILMRGIDYYEVFPHLKDLKESYLASLPKATTA
ncbi:MAG: twitch domain-containing radical SAM protein, partial [Bdellovibrionales bacterium]|nr:twitch domain-containing radical SAM protein [Bdellovibrionales bacterium]NQZ17989.1 twitch domain-containing radical SAM protein [Bdellovibrionales bacterium]